jgi:putative transposase
VFIPKYRRKALYGELRKHLGDVFHDLAKQRESKIEQGNLVIDHVHMLISIPPKYSVAQVIGFIKGKSAIHISLRLNLQNRLAAVFERYSNAYYQVRLYRDEILPAAKRALELTRQHYQRGDAIYDDLLTSQRTYSAANLAYLGALLEVWVAEAELDGLLLTGSLTMQN